MDNLSNVLVRIVYIYSSPKFDAAISAVFRHFFVGIHKPTSSVDTNAIKRNLSFPAFPESVVCFCCQSRITHRHFFFFLFTRIISYFGLKLWSRMASSDLRGRDRRTLGPAKHAAYLSVPEKWRSIIYRQTARCTCIMWREAPRVSSDGAPPIVHHTFSVHVCLCVS